MWIKIAVQEVGPITLVAFRVLFGLLFGIVVILIQRVRLPNSFKEWSPLLLLGITNVAIPFFLISWGEQSIELGRRCNSGRYSSSFYNFDRPLFAE